MMRFYKLPTGVAGGMTDSKLPDNQAGYEKALTVALAAMSGPDFVYESIGMLASLLGCSLEAMVIDDEMITSIRRAMKGIEVTDESLSVDVIDQAARHVGHYLGNAQTLALMETEYVYPSLADRDSPDTWTDQGAQDIYARAKTRVREVLATPCPTHITPENDARVRANFPIRLDADIAQGRGSRWTKGQE